MQRRTLTSKPLDPEITALAERHHADPEALLAIFQELQARHGGLTRAAIADVARALRLPVERAYGVATFYSMLNSPPRPRPTIRVCDGPACWLNSAQEARAAVEAEFGREWAVERTSCLGLCDRAPAALMDGQPFGPLLAENVLVERSRWLGEPKAYARPRSGEVRILLARAGTVDPDALDSALEHGAYTALLAALNRPPEAVIAEIEAAGLTGRGGAGFPAGRKWRMVAQESRSPKYIVCNADESEPLVFKDRVLIDSDPHQLLEGMALAGYAVGAREGFIYIRGEYEPQAARLERAVQQAETHGWLGENIGGRGGSGTGGSQTRPYGFHIHVHRGAGAYICGEETALLESLEGKRGEPRVRPPYPTTHGYHGLPTVVNNVETFSAVPAIIANGAAWYREVGAGDRPVAPTTPGTKMYTLLGHVNRPGLFEAPYGLTLRQIIDDFGDGMRPGAAFHFALTGGAAGTIVPPSLLDVPIDYASAAKGVSLGAGAFLICDQTVSPVALLRELLHFFEVESCGKCTPCRIGTREARVILDRLAAGQGHAGDVIELTRLADILQTTSFCGLGQSAAIPMKSALKHFVEAFEGAAA
jgi:NADH:ubiquinone oxidoreductase subunit F (NADH-binding)/NADH:ubiquinone oxidoreductase subunit E